MARDIVFPLSTTKPWSTNEDNYYGSTTLRRNEIFFTK